jgi:hypothetical protein
MAGKKHFLFSIMMVASLLSCGENPAHPEGVEPLLISQWGPSTVLPGTDLLLTGTGFIPAQLGDMTIKFEGQIGDTAVNHTAALVYRSDEQAVWKVDSGFVSSTIDRNDPFTGRLTVRRRITGYSKADEASVLVAISVVRNLQPTIKSLSPEQIYIGDQLVLQSTNLLLPEEGQSLVLLSGDYEVISPPTVKHIHNVVIPLSVESRTTASFQLSPDKFGIYPGTFSGTAHLENHVADGSPQSSDSPANTTLQVLAPYIEEFSPQTVRRGQRVNIIGRGFVPIDPVGESATLILLDGIFTAKLGKEISYQGKDAMLLFPENHDGNTAMEVILRVTIGPGGDLTGLGLIPGTFTGTAYPELYFGSESVRGIGFDFSLLVAPQLQLVYVKYLPSFDEAFHGFGLHPVRAEIKKQILSRCNRDYSAFNVEFVDERPTQFAEYSIIELSGTDPNGANLLGLDNTTGKDNYNLRFNDVVGGKNAETEEQGFYAYGGVFLESFLLFSPTLSKGITSLSSSSFDSVFSPFVPELGGTPVVGGEYPGGGRAALIAEAIRVLGNLVGGTVAHEIGHSLGLAMVPGHPEEYHNLGDNPAWLMDAGTYRPFEERAEVDGQGPEVFAPYNFDYLYQILPKG